MGRTFEDLNPDVLQALLLVASRLDAAGVSWALTGSLGHALQGVPVRVNEVDIQTDERGAYRAEQYLAAWRVNRVELSSTDRIRSHLGEFSVQGVKVEVMGAVQKRLPAGGWEPAADVASHRTHVQVAGRSVPVLTLTSEAEAYAALGRAERAQLLRSYAETPAGGD